MSFNYPIFIYIMLPALMMLFYFMFKSSRENFKMFDKEVLEKLRLESKALSKNSRYALFFSAFVLMVFALAQPVIKEGEIKVEAKSADILIGIDISDSMKAEDRYPNRLDFSKHKAMSLIKSAPHNRIGVLAFAKHDYIVSPLSVDHASVAFLLSKINTNNITEKGTHLDSMLNSAISMLEHAKEKNILLFTDGGDSEDFSKEIELAKESGLKIFIIGVGTQEGSPVRSAEGGFVKQNGNILISKINPKLKSLALETGGVYIESLLGDADINAMMSEIEKMTHKSTLKEETIPQYTQLFYYPLALAVLFLLLAFSSFPKSLRKSFILILLAFLSVDEAKAGLLDFQKLQEAKTAYSQKEYEKASVIYEDFIMESSEAVYNLGNSLYKEGKYDRALKVYETIETDKEGLKAKALSNSGNAQVKLKKYEEALKVYEESLKLEENRETRENYEAVKKFLEEQKKKEDKKQKKSDKDQKSDKNKEKNSQDKSKKEQDKKKENKKENKKDKESQDKKENKDKQKSEAKDKEKQESKKNETQEKKNQKDKKKEEMKSSKPKDKQKSDKKAKQIPVSQQKMSELEAKKWLKMIKNSQKGHLYKMDAKEHKEDENEKPW